MTSYSWRLICEQASFGDRPSPTKTRRTAWRFDIRMAAEMPFPLMSAMAKTTRTGPLNSGSSRHRATPIRKKTTAQIEFSMAL